MKRRILAMLLVIAMLMGNIPVQSLAIQSEPNATTNCIIEGCTYSAGHSGECSTFVACTTAGCTYASGHTGNCSNSIAAEDVKLEKAADATVYVTVSNRGELGMAYEAVTVSDINADGKISVDEALHAAHTVYGKSYASEKGTVKKLWDAETTNVSFFVNHEVISMDVNAETVSDGDHLVASVDQDAVNDYDKYSCFDVLETSAKAGENITLTLTDDAGNTLAGMEIGLWGGNGSTTMTGLSTDVNGTVTLSLDQEGLYCITAKGMVMESSIDVNTMEITSIEVPIIAPVCIVNVSGTTVLDAGTVYVQDEPVTGVVAYSAAAASTETELVVSGNKATLNPSIAVGSYTLTGLVIYKQTTYESVSIVSVTQNGNTFNVVLAEDTAPDAAIQAGFSGSGTGPTISSSGNKCTLNNGRGEMAYKVSQMSTSVTMNINFSIPMGTAYAVTPPTGEGITFNGGDSVYEGQDYTFSVAVNEGYDGSAMIVKVNGQDVTGENGTYTVAAVSEDLVITVENVTAKTAHTVTLPEVPGVTVSGKTNVYAGEDYSFTVAVDEAYDASNMVVTVNDAEVQGENGTYTVAVVSGDLTVQITGVVAKTVCTVSKPDVAGVTVSGPDTVYVGETYSFTVSVDNAYDASAMVVTANEEILNSDNGTYTVAADSETLTITITGVEPKTVCTVTLPEVEGVTVTGEQSVYAGEAYTFTLSVDNAYDASNMVVTVNGEEIQGENGAYKVTAVFENLTIDITGVARKTICLVTKPEMDGVTVNGPDTVYAGESYSFTVAVNDAYDASNMVVTVQNGEEEPRILTADNGTYTVETVSGDLVISITGVTEKVSCTITLTAGSGYTITGAATAYTGDSYSFTVSVNAGYSADNMKVYANGTEVTGANGTYTFTVEENTTITVEGIALPAVSGTMIPVNNNVIDVTDNPLKPFSSYHATVTDIQFTGATVTEAYESGTTVFVMLHSTTDDSAELGITFGHTVNKCTLDNSTGNITLENGEGILTMKVTANYRNAMTKDATYTLIFLREAPKTTVPVCLKNSDTAQMYKNTVLTLDLKDYFEDEESYYLIENGGTKTAIEGSSYSIRPTAAGTLTLVFGASNTVGDCPDHLTVTVTVTEISSGTWIGYSTSNGSIDFVQFTDGQGSEIAGIEAAFKDNEIAVVLPKSYDVSGTVRAVFSRTANASDYPYVTSTSTFNQAYNKRTDTYTNTLSGGAATRTVYVYNLKPGATSNNYVTWTICYSMQNDVPVLAEGVSATAEATITAGEDYTLDLSGLFTDADGDSMTYLVSINGAAAVAADASYSYTTDTAGTYTLVFTANDGKGTSAETHTVTLTVKDSDQKDSMTVSVPEGVTPKFYTSSGFGADGVDILGEEITAEAGENGTYTLQYPVNVTYLSFRDENWGGMAFTVEKDADLTLRQVKLNVTDYDGNTAQTTDAIAYDGHNAVAGSQGWLLVTGKDYTFQAVPQNADLATAVVTKTLEAGAEILEIPLTLGISNPLTITVPAGAKAQLYNYDTGKYYYATELEAKIIRENEDNTVTYSFVGDTKENGVCYIYRVSMPGKITKAGYLNWGEQNTTITYTDADKSNTYRLDDYSGTGSENSDITEDSVLLNINSRNNLSMSVGQSVTLKAYRAWEIIKISYQNYIITPDFTYQIISGSDVVSLAEKDSPSVGEGDWMTLTALKEGTAVIEVTYDAIQATGGSFDGIYGASDPARTGLVVVQVGGNDASVKFGIDGFASRGTKGTHNVTYNPNAKRDWDAEFDTLYFTGNSGQLKFSPTAGSDITQVAVSGNKGASWTVLKGEDGVYTAPIVSGNNIIRVTTSSGTAYQVVRGDKVSVQISEVSGDGDNAAEPGETVRVTLKGLHMPIPKMAGHYNPGYYGNTDGYSSVHLNYSVNGQTVYGPGTQYNFINVANYLDIAIPEDWNSDTLTLSDGYIGFGVMGLTAFDTGGDSHRNIPDSGCQTRGNESTWHTRSVLPEITIDVEGVKTPVAVTGVTLDKSELTLNVGEEQQLTAVVEPADADNMNVSWSSDNLAVATAADGMVKALSAGAAVITVTTEDGEITASCTVTVKQPVESISITPETAEVTIGNTVELTAVVLPENATEKSVSWSSGDENIATVENGLVTGVKEGTVSITAQAGDQTTSCTVTVKPVPIHTAEVYFSVSHDDQFLKSEATGSVLVLQKLTVPYFDLATYKMGKYSLEQTDADYGKPTMLHLYIYATEVLYYGVNPTEAGKGYLRDYLGSDVFAYSGSAGSICIDKFWGMDYNLNYYHNYRFPKDAYGTGITADQVVLRDGDIVTIGHFTSMDFCNDPSSVFNYLVAGNDTVVTTAAQNEIVTLNVYRAGSDLGKGGTNTPVNAALDIYYCKADAVVSGNVTQWTKLGTTDTNGKLEADISELAAGQYILAVAGQKGQKFTNVIVSTPGGICLNVTESTLGTDVQSVVNLIKKIGTVDLNSEAKITAARNAYKALTDDQKKLVTNYATLIAAETELARLKQEVIDIAAAKTVTDMIAAIGEVTLNSENKIMAARHAYEELTAAQKILVTGYEVLTAAEATLTQLKADIAAAEAVAARIAAIGEVTLNSEEAITAARNAYNALTEDQKNLVANYTALTDAETSLAELKKTAADTAAANEVKNLIDTIGTVDLGQEEAIQAVRNAYDALTELQKDLVGEAYLKKLTDAEEKITQMKADVAAAEAVDTQIAAIGEITLDSEETIHATRAAYNVLTEAQKTLVTNYEVLTAAEAKLAELKADVAAAEAVDTQIAAIGEITLDSEEAITAARAAYNALTDAQKALVINYDMLTDAEVQLAQLKTDIAAAEAIDELIAAIGVVTLNSEEAINAARTAYNELTEAQKALVTGYEILTAAETKLAELKADIAAAKTVDDLIESIGDVTPESESDITAARTAYDALTDAQKAMVANYDELISAEERLALLKLSDADVLKMYNTTGEYLENLEEPGVGSTDGEWRVIGLARSGHTVPASYYSAVETYVRNNITTDERLHEAKSTDNSRVILALTAIGKDVTNVAGHNLLTGLGEMAYIRNQGFNGIIWAMIAFDSHDYEIPSGDVTREGLIDAILAAQLSDGGWALGGETSDPDITGMTLQALAPYVSDSTVNAAVNGALNWLSSAQSADGTFAGSEGTTCESQAQVIVALTSLGIDPEEDTRFVKNGVSAMDALMRFYVEGGGFRHGIAGKRNMMATEQGYYALVSYYRFLQKQTALYDMSDVTLETEAQNQAAANVVIALINDIGNVDATKEDKIETARAAYNALTDAQKALVTNYSTLTAAETRLAELTGTPEDRAKVADVQSKIDAIGTVTLNSESVITVARNAYNALTTKQKNLVGSEYLKKLTDAEAMLAALVKAQADEAAAAAVVQKISNIGSTITLGSEAKITTARNAYNALTADQKALVTNYQTLINAENALNALKSTVSVTFSLLGCYKHGSSETAVHTLASGNLQTWISAKTYKIQPGSTVKDLFEKALTEAGLSWKNPTGNYIESITRNGVTVGEFTNGTYSGWMYTLNGKHPGLGVAQQTLVNGDVVVFHYTDDYTKEEGSTSGSTTGTTTGTSTGTVSGSTNYITTNTTKVNTETAESVDRMIEDIGEEITIESEAKILAARAAYDKLTEAQKKLVQKYDDLVAAETKLAELKGASGEKENAYLVTGDYIQGLGTPGVGNIGGEWMVIGLARSGRIVPTGYYDHVLRYVSENINEKQQLHSAKSSDNSRLILALTAIGKDVTNVDGHDLLKGLTDMDYIRKQGINGPIWALLAFDSGNYPVPEGNVSRQKLIDVILEAQLSDGGWALSGERSDPDMTGMALQALAPYMESDMDVKKAVEAAVWCLSKMQNDNGSYTSVDGPNSESIAQVIVALAALGIDADTDARFVKNGISALDALLTYYIPGGGFRHVLEGNLDGMSTEQAFYALVAYNRMKQNQNFLYDMTDIIDMGGDVIAEETTEPTVAPAESLTEEETDNGNAVVIWTGVMIICAAAIAVLLLNRKKLFGKFL